MSELSKAIGAHQGQRVMRVGPTPKIISIDSNVSEIPTIDCHEYRLGVKFEVKARLTKDELQFGLDNARRMIIQRLFGEFRDPITRIHEALFDRDFEQARKELWLLEQQMFGDESV